MRKLVLFDIDGTLLRSAGAGRRAIHRALWPELGSQGPVDGVRFDGKTDPQIISELLAAAGHPDPHDADAIRVVCERYALLLEAELKNGNRQVHVLAGVVELLAVLEARADVLLGLLTGNIVRGAELKLRRAGVDPARFRVGAFGSDAANRNHLPPIAVRRATPLMGREPTADDIVIVGDTPADVTCGESVRARAIAVATGSYTEAELRAAGAYAVFADLTDTPAVVNAILG